MQRLIDANEILKSEHQHYDYTADEYYVLVRDIENAPIVDAVPVVRCKDCRYREHEEPGMVWCPNVIGSWIEENGYCSRGERREDAEGHCSSEKGTKMQKTKDEVTDE